MLTQFYAVDHERGPDPQNEGRKKGKKLGRSCPAAICVSPGGKGRRWKKKASELGHVARGRVVARRWRREGGKPRRAIAGITALAVRKGKGKGGGRFR